MRRIPVFQEHSRIGVGRAEPVGIAAQALFEFHLGGETESFAREAGVRKQRPDVAGARLDEPWREVGPSAQSSDRFRQLPHRNHLAVCNVDGTADKRVAARGERDPADGLRHIGEVPAVFARAKDHRRQPVQHPYHKARDHLGQITARVLARTVVLNGRTTIVGNP